jgi:antitoxin (DNA-binding transcriptional repressor) of toxin-antitoxin stability system
MEVSITQFRRNLFSLVDQAMEGKEVWVMHKGRRFRIAPDGDEPFDRLSRITPLEVINPDGPGLDDPSWKEEMRLAWESDWADL